MLQEKYVIGVVGVGYVGLSVAVGFASKGYRTIAYDTDAGRISELNKGIDRTHEVGRDELCLPACEFTHKADRLGEANVFIVTVPTPIDHAKKPDLTELLAASQLVGRYLSKGAIVTYESTVYPGTTEELCAPELERISGLVRGRDFLLGYSPERINPGDKNHTFEHILKVVAASDQPALDAIAELYVSVVAAGVIKLSSIRVAEAAKLVENSQRDVNIAFMNELSQILSLLGLDTGEVLAAAKTKWNFLDFTPGLVGGHCISVDPFYLAHCAEMKGYCPEVILAGRRVNDRMGQRIAHECVRLLSQSVGLTARVQILGLTYKENVPDIRNSRVVDIICELKRLGVEVQVSDYWASTVESRRLYDIELQEIDDLPQADAVIVAVGHERYVEGGWQLIRSLLSPHGGIVIDVRGILPIDDKPENIELLRL